MCYLIPGLNTCIVRSSLGHAVDPVYERGKEAISEGETELKTIWITGLFSQSSKESIYSSRVHFPCP